QRVNWSEPKQKYVMLGVTGPNEYENNVNNNWYTNKVAIWCLQYTMDVIVQEQQNNNEIIADLLSRLAFKEEETELWKHIIDHMYLPTDADRLVFLQQD